MTVPVDALLTPEHSLRSPSGPVPRAPGAAAGNAARAATRSRSSPPTTDLSVSLIQSVFYAFGAGVLEPSTGILCHNRGACFSSDPAARTRSARASGRCTR